MCRHTLDTHFAKVDEMLETIRACEAVLDALLLTPDDPANFVSVSVMPPPSPVPPSPAPSEIVLEEAVADRIRNARKAKGWRQKDLAEATGIARPNIARLESGRRMPKITTLHRIGQALGVSVEALLGPV